MSKLFETFTGHHLRLTMDKGLKQTIEHNGTLKTIEQPKEIEGYLVEECDDFYYLGVQPGEINMAIAKWDISTIEMCEPDDSKDEKLQSFLKSTATGEMN